MIALHILFAILNPNGNRTFRFTGKTDLKKWKLLRLDDNGNSFVVAEYKTHSEAQDAQRSYEKKGHKQTYWVEKIETTEE